MIPSKASKGGLVLRPRALRNLADVLEKHCRPLLFVQLAVLGQEGAVLGEKGRLTAHHPKRCA